MLLDSLEKVIQAIGTPDDNGRLALGPEKRENELRNTLASLFRKGTGKKLATKGVEIEQIWAQLEQQNESVLQDIEKPLAAMLSGQADILEKEEQQTDSEESESKYESAEEAFPEKKGALKDLEESGEEEDDEEEELKESAGEEEEDDDEQDEEDGSQEFEEEEDEQQLKGLDDFSEDDEPDQQEEDELGEAIRYKDMYRSKEQIREADAKEREVFEMARESYMNEDMVDEIEAIEDKMVGEKDWQLKGEVQARQRPVNSLLAEHLDFAMAASKVAPSAEETKVRNDNIEEIILQRIKDGLFDDPVRKFAGRSEEEALEEGKDRGLKFEKAGQGLGEEYADLLQKRALGGEDPFANQEVEKVHEEIDQLQAQLFSILDQMSQTRYVRIQKPKAEIEVEKGIAALQLEEKTPIGISMERREQAGDLLDPKKGVQLLSREEQERGAEHRKKKRVMRAKQKARISEEKAARRGFEGAALAKFEKALQKQRKNKKGEKDSAKPSVGRHKSTEFFKTMENLARKDIERKQEKAQARDQRSAAKTTSSKKWKL